MGYHTHESYVLQMELANASPADNTSYLIGIQRDQLTTGGTLTRVYVPRSGTIRRVYVAWYNNTQNCTAEDTSLYIRKNNTTDSSAIYTGSFSHTNSPQTSSNLNFSVAAGDYIHLKLATPAWVTNPTGLYMGVFIEVQC